MIRLQPSSTLVPSTTLVRSDHVFTITLTHDTGSGPVGFAGQTVTFTLVPGTTGSTITAINGVTQPPNTLSGSCVTSSTGTRTVTIHGTSPGTATLNASYMTTLDSGSLTVKGSATKTFEPLKLTVTPGSATNDVHTDHTFTITLTKDTGSGPVGFAGQTVSFTLVPGTTGSTITAINGVAQPAGTLIGTCTTDHNGQCT